MPCENCNCGQAQEETTPTLRERVTRFLTPYQYPPAPPRTQVMPVLDVPEDYEGPPSAAPIGGVPQGKLVNQSMLAPLTYFIEDPGAWE